jgi:hypothetical protein
MGPEKFALADEHWSVEDCTHQQRVFDLVQFLASGIE